MAAKTKKKSVWKHYREAIGEKLIGMYVFSSFIYVIGTLAGGVIVPIFYKGIIDSITSGNQTAIFHFFWLMLATSTAQYVFIRLFEHINLTIDPQSHSKLAAYTLSSVTEHSYQFFINNFAGSLVNKARKFVGAFSQMTDIIITDFLYAIINISGILFVLFRTSTPIAFVALAWFVLFILVTAIFTKNRLPIERKRGELESKVTGVISDIITNALNLKLFSSKKREEAYFGKSLKEEYEARVKAWKYAEKMYSTIGFITLLAQSSLVFISIVFWSRGEVSAGTIVLVISYSGTLFSRLSGISSSVRRFFEAYTNASEFAGILDTKIEIEDAANPEESRIKEGEVHFNNVTFSYKQGNPIFEGLDLVIKPGEKIGIVGTSGAGKTTITKLLLRFADVTGGAILIDGQDIRNIRQDDLRAAVAYVPQDPILFHRSLSENIAYGKPEAPKKEIIEAAKLAHAHEFIENLHYKYETFVGERGVKLSGGERQRVAIARAILKDSPILILDEATSSLDSVSETHIKAALDVLMKGRTTIVIAHRLSTIEKMDRIIVMEEGRIVEEGTHKALLDKKGMYHNFWSHQQRGFIK